MMFSAIRNRMSYANVTATLALFFAMSGGALAASHYLITSTKQISPKVLKSLKGANGKNGANGANGAQGAQGPAGAAGAKGETGAAGAPGAGGQSVTSATLPKGNAKCKEGGSEFTAANGATTACNGKEGSPWTAGGTLPSGSTETGTWAIGPLATEEVISSGNPSLLASFPVPLKAPLGGEHVHVINLAGEEVIFEEEKGKAVPQKANECPGSAAAPTAEPGNFCVYEFGVSKVELVSQAIVPAAGGEGAGTTGAVVERLNEKIGGAAYGTWAVTAP